MKGHGYRTWAFGSALAALDRNELDPEIFYVAGLLHDYGVAQAVPGEDFVLRSASRVERCVADAELDEAVALAIADSISIHSTAAHHRRARRFLRVLHRSRRSPRPRRPALWRPHPVVLRRRPREAPAGRRHPRLHRSHRGRGKGQSRRPLRPAAPVRLQPAAAHESAGLDERRDARRPARPRPRGQGLHAGGRGRLPAPDRARATPPRASPGDRHLLRQVRDLPRCGGARGRRDRCSRSTTTAAPRRTRPAGSTTTRRSSTSSPA